MSHSPYPTTGTILLAGTLALRFGVPTVPGLDAEWQAFLAPLQFEVFSGIGSLRRSGGVFLDAVADAGFGVRYDVPSFALLRGVVAQSDVLSGLRLSAKFPLWVSDPDRIGPDEEAFGFRWLVGVETGSVPATADPVLRTAADFSTFAPVIIVHNFSISMIRSYSLLLLTTVLALAACDSGDPRRAARRRTRPLQRLRHHRRRPAHLRWPRLGHELRALRPRFRSSSSGRTASAPSTRSRPCS